MLTGTLEKLGGQLGRRFLFAVWLPNLLFWGGLTALTVTGWGWADAARWWHERGTEARAAMALGAFSASLLIGALWSAQLPLLVRLLEGHWPRLPGLNAVRERCTDRYRLRHRTVVTDPKVFAREAPYYPLAEDDVMPTRFGNVLRSAETHPYDRYGIDAVLVWPRLYPVLPQRFAAQLAVAASDVDLMVTMCGLSVLFAGAGGVLAAIVLSWYAALACGGGGLLLGWIAYRGAVHTALAYAALVKSAFDVHRGLLIDALGLERPVSWTTELAQWRQLGNVWLQGTPEAGDGARALRYPQHPCPPCPLCHPPQAGGPASGP
ncbi:hypothetical protein [Streptomyces sp. NPDC096132]|uniref:hypothetical protein n=1 Tax=Streptomyces sp. NPDC096132 TaxID=3366075 RepID=UPI00382345C6